MPEERIVTIKKNNEVYCTCTPATFEKAFLDDLYKAGYVVYLDGKKLTVRQARSQI